MFTAHTTVVTMAILTDWSTRRRNDQFPVLLPLKYLCLQGTANSVRTLTQRYSNQI